MRNILFSLFSAPYCSNQCKYQLKRWHATCLWCMYRRMIEGKLDMSKYTFYPDSFMVVPKISRVYLLTIDDNRKCKKLKEILLKKVCTIAEFLAS